MYNNKSFIIYNKKKMGIESTKENILDQIEEKVKGFQDEIREIRESLSSGEAIETKLESVKQRAKAAKEELEETIGNMRESAQEKFKTTLQSLNDIINTKLSIWNNPSGDGASQGSGSWGWVENKWILERAGNWIKEQRDKTTIENLEKKPWETLLRWAGFALTWLWWLALAYKWVKSLRKWAFKKEDKKEWNKWSGTEREEEEDKTFWDKRYWKVIKYSGIWTVAYYVAHWLKTSQWDPSRIFDWKQKENSESNENFKCKWWQYLWIDISSHNGSIDLNSFKNWNRTQRDSDDNKKRWVSLMYIRASDNVKPDKRVGEHVDNVCNYNNQVNEDEKIAVWFYHRLSWWDWRQQADEFIKTYKNQSAKLWWKRLIPMVDVEDWSDNWWVTKAWNTDNKDIVRNNTLSWINYVEKKLGVTPWIYASDSVNTHFFWTDSRFDKYKRRIARYWSNPAQSDMHQYTDKWRIWGFNNSVDLNLTQNVKQFLA